MSNQKLTLDFVKKEFEKRGYILLSAKYVNSITYLDYLCPKNHEGHIRWNHFSAGHGCPICSGHLLLGDGKTKTCSECKEVKIISAYYRNKNRKSNIRPQCKECTKKRSKKISSARWNKIKKQRDVAYNYIFDYLSLNPCIDCGEDDLLVLEFDHVRGVKEDNISHLVSCSAGKTSRIEKEIAKCDVVCANCHRKRTYSRFGVTNNRIRYLKRKDSRPSKGGQ